VVLAIDVTPRPTSDRSSVSDLLEVPVGRWSRCLSI
jgi:hypothetical protein